MGLFNKSFLLIAVVSTVLLPVNTVLAENGSNTASQLKNKPLDFRVERLERLMSSQKQLELLYRMKQLQQENQQLRGQLEEQANEIRQLKEQQRTLYTDLNRRLGMMESGSTGAAGSGLTMGAESEAVSQTTEQVTKPEDSQIAPVVDKTMVRPSKYGVTQREEIIVSTGSEQSEKSKQAAEVTEKQPGVEIKPMTEADKKAEQKAYQQAYDEMRAKQYNKARDSFKSVVEKYPQGRYAHIAQYWVAESSYAQQNYKQAITDYQHLLDAYPVSPKKAEAELKQAFSYYELGDKQTARKTIDQLLLKYPDTTEAAQAKRLLKKL
jgi:tol-pal system protein YbgF